MTTRSIKMRVLTESTPVKNEQGLLVSAKNEHLQVTQKEIDQLYKDMDSCSYFRNIVPQKYTDQKEWPIHLDTIFINLIDKEHVPVSIDCLKCKEDNEYIQLQYKDYDDFMKAASEYKGNA